MASLCIVRGPTTGTGFALEKDITIIGRNPDCDLVVPNPAVSRQHISVVRSEGKPVETRGYATSVNGHRLTSGNRGEGR
jgi:hypothetical protein